MVFLMTVFAVLLALPFKILLALHTLMPVSASPVAFLSLSAAAEEEALFPGMSPT